MVSDLALAADGDLLVRGGDLVVVTGPAAVAQDWGLRVGMFKGEWSLDRRVGIDYRTLLLDGSAKPTDPLVRYVLDKVTRETAGVASVEQLTFGFDRSTRELSVVAVVQFDSGQTGLLSFTNVIFPDDLTVPPSTGATS